jgi:D-alanyl-D-alanine dipeptidase
MHSTTIDGITITERDAPPVLVELRTTARITLNPAVSDDWRIRPDIRARLEAAGDTLPRGLCFMVFEAFRSRARQYELWRPEHARISGENPGWSAERIYIETARWVSPPDGFGSGHQAGAAIDVTLATPAGEQMDMGTPMQGFTPHTPTASKVSATARANRDLLTSTLAAQGLVNYPDEWWHFSYGDRLWAEVTGRTAAFFAPVD